jgi:metal-responsive CopG/Arc/MetJ family transcriptional regulator
MTETQVLFRVDSELLKELDSSLSSSGFKTRNEWFRNVVRNFLEDAERKSLLKKLERLKVDMTDEDVAEMVRAWKIRKTR